MWKNTTTEEFKKERERARERFYPCTKAGCGYRAGPSCKTHSGNLSIPKPLAKRASDLTVFVKDPERGSHLLQITHGHQTMAPARSVWRAILPSQAPVPHHYLVTQAHAPQATMLGSLPSLSAQRPVQTQAPGKPGSTRDFFIAVGSAFLLISETTNRADAWCRCPEADGDT